MEQLLIQKSISQLLVALKSHFFCEPFSCWKCAHQRRLSSFPRSLSPHTTVNFTFAECYLYCGQCSTSIIIKIIFRHFFSRSDTCVGRMPRAWRHTGFWRAWALVCSRLRRFWASDICGKEAPARDPGRQVEFDNTADRFPAVRWPGFWVSAHCTKWRIQGQFHGSSSRSLTLSL